MSRIKEFENIPDISIENGETLEEAVADCKALFEKYNKELYGGTVSLSKCSEANLVLLALAHRSHHTMEYSNACLRAELLVTSTGSNLDNLAPIVGVERMEAGKATAVVRFTLSAAHQTRKIRTCFRLEKGSDFSFSSGLKMKAPVDDAKLRYLVIDRKPLTRFGGYDYEVRCKGLPFQHGYRVRGTATPGWEKNFH